MYPTECGEQLGRDPSKNGNSKSLVLKGFFWEENTLGLVPSCRPHSLGYACTLYAPTSPPLTFGFHRIFLQESAFFCRKLWGIKILGKIQRGLTNGGLSPKFSEKIGGKSFLENRAFSGQIGAISGLVGTFSGPIGTNSSAPHSHGGRAEIGPKGPFLARFAPFGLSPPLLSPRLDFPEIHEW